MKHFYTVISLVLILFFSTGSYACDTSSINIISVVDNGNGTKNFTLDITVDVGTIDGFSYGFALLFGNSQTMKPIVLTNSPQKLSRAGFDDLTSNFGLNIGNTFSKTGEQSNNFIIRYGNRSDVLTYETVDGYFGFGSFDYNCRITVTVYGLVETITLDADFRSLGKPAVNEECLKESIVPNASTTPNTTEVTATLSGGGVSICEGTSKTLNVAFTGTSPYTLGYSADGINYVVNNVTSSLYDLNIDPKQTTEYQLIFAYNTTANGTVGTNTEKITVNSKPTLTLISSTCDTNQSTFNVKFSSTGTISSTVGSVDNFSKTVSGITNGATVILTSTLNSCSTSLSVSAPNCSLGVQDVTWEGFSLFPNPVSQFLNISNKNGIDAIEIYNSMGQLVSHFNIYDTACKLNVSYLSTGLYILRTSSNDKHMVSRFVKQ
jgi:hypothetical protein